MAGGVAAFVREIIIDPVRFGPVCICVWCEFR